MASSQSGDNRSNQASSNQTQQSGTATISALDSWRPAPNAWQQQQQQQPSVLQQVQPAPAYEKEVDDAEVRVLVISAPDPLSHPKNVELAPGTASKREREREREHPRLRT